MELDHITIGVLAFTVLCIGLGAGLGAIRGRNRSILRCILIILCAVGAFFLREIVVDWLLSLEINGQTIPEILQQALHSLGYDIPTEIADFMLSIEKLMLSIVAYFVIFFALQFASWIFLFPILKIFIRKGKKKGVLVGMGVGILQGLLVAFFICAPLTGLLAQTDKIVTTLGDVQIKQEQTACIDGITTLEENENQAPAVNPILHLELEHYNNSFMGEFYNTTGGWYFDALTVTKDAHGEPLKLDTVTDVFSVIIYMSNDVLDIADTLQQIDPDGGADQAAVLNNIGDVLTKVGKNVEILDQDGEKVFGQLLNGVKKMLAPEDDPDITPEIRTAIDNLTVENLKLGSAGKAFYALGTYLEKVHDPEILEHITIEDAKQIVEAIHENEFILDMIGGNVIVEIDEEDHDTFVEAIENIPEITEEQKETLMELLAILESKNK